MFNYKKILPLIFILCWPTLSPLYEQIADEVFAEFPSLSTENKAHYKKMIVLMEIPPGLEEKNLKAYWSSIIKDDLEKEQLKLEKSELLKELKTTLDDLSKKEKQQWGLVLEKEEYELKKLLESPQATSPTKGNKPQAMEFWKKKISEQEEQKNIDQLRKTTEKKPTLPLERHKVKDPANKKVKYPTESEIKKLREMVRAIEESDLDEKIKKLEKELRIN